MTENKNAYQKIIEDLFFGSYSAGAIEVPFVRADIPKAAERQGVQIPMNLGDVVYSLRYRTSLPEKVLAEAPEGKEWAIFPAGRSVYAFRPVSFNAVEPRKGLTRTRIPDSTPGVIARYAMSDEQALLAKIRYNRLVDIFAGITCYSLQNHLRTSISVRNPLSGKDEKAQVETDELYVGLDRHGAHYVIPVQAKGGTDNLSVVQIWQDFNVVSEKFSALVPRPIAAQSLPDGAIALFEFSRSGHYDLAISREAHYVLVPEDQIDDDDLVNYREMAERVS